MTDVWTQHGKVRGREADGLMELTVDGLTTQGKYYKPLIYEFFRKAWRGSRPATGSLATRDADGHPLPWGAGGGDFSVEIGMEYVGEPPWMDLDNLAKAILDAIKGYAFHDDAQVARLLVERRPGERERITVRVSRLP
ncbi:RusA family crossover junction endodeoxyribonuclease [Phenylobacterium sp.]|uniref:RusA family crossover junction endodeoxyribonuclease n=1 Tax=Phenylobacterium sp. TaxID=1871053 RepID=UPI0025CF69BD|nr:RusA family crossover junction endodeoxyribonuclease [Phenylobacterium sp.]